MKAECPKEKAARNLQKVPCRNKRLDMSDKTKKEINHHGFQWDPGALRLPRMVEADPRGQELLNRLTALARPLWSGGKIMVPEVPFTQELAKILRNANRGGQLVRSLEEAESKLAAEARGLGLADQKSGASRGERVSRLLVLADNGAERFYRQVEKLLRQNGPRVFALRLEVDAETLGQELFQPDDRVLLLMLDHKEAVSAMLLALAE
jgi:hypothetical protein